MNAHRYNYAEVVSSDYPALRHKALPIIRFLIDSDDSILQVQLLVNESPRVVHWFSRASVVLYMAQSRRAIIAQSRWTSRLMRWLAARETIIS